MNDAKLGEGGGRKVELSEFRDAMRKLIGLANVRTHRTLLIGITRVSDMRDRESTPRFSNDAITVYNDALRELAANEGCEFVDVFTVLDPAHDLSDSVHPNAAGYEKLAEVIRHVLVP
jgi:lysophospholipase L1-like esterase